ncbi:acyl-CoA synthetase [Natrinema sp. H-ect4]|uniref:acyl-CoA synthetase n=1 Tax=Natrinema sp. H-ect4 TaxID=3242699 RepID=UPI0035A92780
MTYNDAYEAVADLYDKEAGWEEHAHVGDKESFNVATEALGRHSDSDETGLRIRDFESGETETYTFAELDAAANRVANYLSEHTDRGARIGAKLPTQFELYAVVFGTIKAGRIYLPLAPVFGPDALNYRLEDSRASVLFTTASGCEIVDADLSALDRIVTVDGGSVNGSTTVDDYDAVREHDDAFDAVETHPNDPFTLTYTSGTTGSPKGVLSPHRGPVELHAYTEYVVDLRPDDVYLVAASPSWSYGLNMGTIMSGVRGTAIGCYRGQFDPLTFFETLEEWDVDNAMIPPTALRQSRAAGIDLSEYDIDLRVLISAGEALDQDTVDWCEEGLGAPPQDSYGLTEGGMVVCNYAFDDWEVKPGSMGKTIPGTEVALLDEDGNEVEQGEVGEIAIKRDDTSIGTYWGRPEKTLETFTGLWLRTSDLARQDEDGYFWYVSRADNVIISSGYRIGPEEVEETLLNHPAVEEAAVVGKDHDTRGEIVAAYVTLVSDYEPSAELEDELSDFAREELSKHEYPREIAFIDELPKTASGKIKRAELGD